MKSWYSRVSDIELKDGSIRTNYVVTFETDNFKLKREVEKYLQGIMDKTEPQIEDLQDWKDRMWAEAIVTEPTISKMEQVDEPQTDCAWR